MELAREHKLWYRSDLEEAHRPFADRTDAGRALAEMLEGRVHRPAMVIAVPAGGVPVADVVARELGLPLDVAVVSKVTPAWDSEIGYGAVAFDGTVQMNQAMCRRLRIGPEQSSEGIEATRQKVERRMRFLRGDSSPPDLSGRTAVVIDDGLASGYTLYAAAEALRRCGAERIVVAVPTGPRTSIPRIALAADAVYCANLRSSMPFAVADAYRRWRDVSEAEAAEILQRHRRRDREQG